MKRAKKLPRIPMNPRYQPLDKERKRWMDVTTGEEMSHRAARERSLGMKLEQYELERRQKQGHIATNREQSFRRAYRKKLAREQGVELSQIKIKVRGKSPEAIAYKEYRQAFLKEIKKVKSIGKRKALSRKEKEKQLKKLCNKESALYEFTNELDYEPPEWMNYIGEES